MSFDMNPLDEDPHGECRQEIHRLERLVKKHAAEINRRRGEMSCAREAFNEAGITDGTFYHRIKKLTAENARLRRQVERLVGLVSEAWYSGGTMPYCESGIKQRADAILADEPGETE